MFFFRAGQFTLLAKAGITNVPTSVITGNIGVSPIAASAMTGLALIYDAAHPEYQTSAQITGMVFAADYGGTTPSIMTALVGDMMSAYSAVGAFQTSGDGLNRHAGLLSGKTLEAGVYEWNTDVSFSQDLYLQGSETDVFVFKIIGNLVVGSSAAVVLQGGVVASNVVWRTTGYVDIGTHAHMEGSFYVKTAATLKTGASLHGRIFAQTAITLDRVTITTP